MTEQPETKAETSQRFKVITSPDFKLVYVNNVGFHASAWDIHLTFGELYRDTSGQEVLEQRVTLAISPPMAKALVAIMGSGVTNYEAQIGEIKLPQEMQVTTTPSEHPPIEPSA